jgi:hypothetical protein
VEAFAVAAEAAGGGAGGAFVDNRCSTLFVHNSNPYATAKRERERAIQNESETERQRGRDFT